MDDENKDEKQPEGTGGESEPEQTDSKGSEAVENTEETIRKADEMLADKGKRVVEAERLNDLLGKAKLYETHAPLLEKVLQDSELVEKLLETEQKGDVESRLAQIEEERKNQKRTELRGAVIEALEKWPTLEKEWVELSDDVERLAKRGLPYREALKRVYLAAHPEEVAAESQRIARDNANVLGRFPSSSSFSPRVKPTYEETKLTSGEKQIAQALGKSEEEYSKLLEKHHMYLRAKGFYDPALEVPL